MDLIRWFWVQLLCIFEAFKKRPQKDTTSAETDPLRWIKPKHKWAWKDRSSEIQAYDERISKMKPNGTVRTMATFDGEHQLHIWLGNTYAGHVCIGQDRLLNSITGGAIDEAERLYGDFLLSLEKISSKPKPVAGKMTQAFRKKLERKAKLWMVACSNGIMCGRDFVYMAKPGSDPFKVLNFRDVTNDGLRKLFALDRDDEKDPKTPLLRRLLSGKLGSKLTMAQVDDICSLPIEGVKALASCRNAGSLRQIIEKASESLGFPRISTIRAFRMALSMHTQYGYVWLDGLYVRSFQHWQQEYRHIQEAGFEMPFSFKEFMTAWKEFRYFDFFRMAKIIDLTIVNNQGAASFLASDAPTIHAQVLEECKRLLPTHHHSIIKAEYLHRLGQNMSFCVGMYARQVSQRSYVVVVSKKKGEDAITTGLVVSNGLLRFQQSHKKNNANAPDCEVMAQFKGISVNAENRKLTVSYPETTDVLALEEQTLTSMRRWAIYKDVHGKARAYAIHRWLQRHLPHISKKDYIKNSLQPWNKLLVRPKLDII